MTTVYVVTSGSYSDYRISSVWDNYEDARARAEADSDSQVEEYVLNSSVNPHPPLWEAKYFDGGIGVSDKAIPAFDVGDVATEVWGFSHPKGPFARGFGVSPEIARKSVSDAVAKAKAQRAGL